MTENERVIWLVVIGFGGLWALRGLWVFLFWMYECCDIKWFHKYPKASRPHYGAVILSNLIFLIMILGVAIVVVIGWLVFQAPSKT